MKKPTIAELQNQINVLKAQLDLRNTYTSLFAGATGQANITSFDPLVWHNIVAPLTINFTALSYLYKTHGIIQTAIDMPVLDALRGGLEIKSDEMDEDDISELQDLMESEGILKAVGEAMTWARLYGGGCLVVNTGQNPELPLDLREIPKLKFYPAARWELASTLKLAEAGAMVSHKTPWQNAASFDEETYLFYGQRIDRSRALTLTGKEAPFLIRWQLQGWGMSEVERMVEDFNIYLRTRDVLYSILAEAKIDVYRMDGLRDILATSEGTAQLEARVQKMNALKNFNAALLLDKNDEYDQKQMTFSGLAEVMVQNRIGIASALRIPLAKLFGLSASGFNSGEDDIENYNAMVESEIRTPLRPFIRKVLDLLIVYKFGENLDFTFEFKPLRVMSEKDIEEIKDRKNARLATWYDRHVVNSREVGEGMKKGNLLDVDTEASKGLLEEFPEVGNPDQPAPKEGVPGAPAKAEPKGATQ